MSQNDQVNEKERENQMLFKTNSMLSVQLAHAKKAKENVETQMIRVYEEAHEVKQIIDCELKEYEQTKTKLSDLRRQNLVLWKHIKKMKKKIRK